MITRKVLNGTNDYHATMLDILFNVSYKNIADVPSMGKSPYETFGFIFDFVAFDNAYWYPNDADANDLYWREIVGGVMLVQLRFSSELCWLCSQQVTDYLRTISETLAFRQYHEEEEGECACCGARWGNRF